MKIRILALSMVFSLSISLGGCTREPGPSVFDLDTTIGMGGDEAQESLFASGSQQIVVARFEPILMLRFKGHLVPCSNASRAAELRKKYSAEIEASLLGDDTSWISRMQSEGELGWRIQATFSEGLEEDPRYLSVNGASNQCGRFLIDLSRKSLEITDQNSVASGSIREVF